MLNGSILVAEDDENDVFMMERAFRKLGLSGLLRTVPNGSEIIKYLLGEDRYCDRDSYPFPLMVFLDLKMPVKNGFEVLAWRQTHEMAKKLPTIVLSSSDYQGDIDRAYALGANSYLQKPSSLEGLQELLQRVQAYWLSVNKWPRHTDPLPTKFDLARSPLQPPGA